MSYSVVGEQILRYRKERGLTQRELGERTGVSSSAVSQWESGGTPDISLLPALSDVLGVTVDALFGRTGADRENMAEAVGGYIASLPRDRRLGELAALMRRAVAAGISGVAETVDMEHRDTEAVYLFRDGAVTDSFTGGRYFLSVVHSAAGGLDDLLACGEEVCGLFSALSGPHALALLVRLCQEPPKFHTAGALALLLGMDRGETEAILAEFTRLRLTEELSLETEEGGVKAYKVNLTRAVVPLLASARLLAEEPAGVRVISDQRENRGTGHE